MDLQLISISPCFSTTACVDAEDKYMPPLFILQIMVNKLIKFDGVASFSIDALRLYVVRCL